MLFNEIYGCYYNTVAKILASAVKRNLTADEMKQIICDNAFSESFLTIIPALVNEQWQLLNPELHTPLKHEPTMPLTMLQKRWLKAISLDPHIKLFTVSFDFLDGIEPLFTIGDYVVFDKYNDGDPYEDESYIQNFHLILDAIHTKKKVQIQYESQKGNHRTILCAPYQLEYSEKDDKFRLLISGCRYAYTINVGRIKACEIIDESTVECFIPKQKNPEFFIMELVDQRNALERVMLHFAHFKKEAERISENSYRVKIYYDHDDETELVIRILSFGPFIKVTEPESFVNLIKERLKMQKSCQLK